MIKKITLITTLVLFVVINNIECKAQNYKAIKIVPYKYKLKTTSDTLYVEEIKPLDYASIIKEHKKVFFYLYKPYCPALKGNDGIGAMSTIMQYCLANNVYVAFIAASTNNLQKIHTSFYNRYNLTNVFPYVIDEKIDRKEYEKEFLQFGEKLNRSCYYIVDQKVLYHSWSHEINLTEFKKLVEKE
jgi:hypothetical protein